MKHDPALIEARHGAETQPARPLGRDRLVAFPAAFAVSGGTYQRLVPRGQTRCDATKARPRDTR